MKRPAIFAFVFPFTLLCAAPGPLTPAQAIKSFQMEKDARIELVAAEPQRFMSFPMQKCLSSMRLWRLCSSLGPRDYFRRHGFVKYDLV